MKVRLGVIYGGPSVEHEVSIISAVQAMKMINPEKYEIIPIYVTKNREWYTGEVLKDIDTYSDLDLLKRYSTNVILCSKNNTFYLQNKNFLRRIKKKVDIILPIVHGTGMEDGILQGYLQSIGVPFVGSDCYTSVVAQDKVLQKMVFIDSGIPVAPYTWFYDIDFEKDPDKIVKECEKLEYPLIVKPATLGSSVGISVCKNEEELRNGITDASEYDRKIVVEKVVPNLREVNISVIGSYKMQETSLIEEVTTDNDLLTYEDKYIGGNKKISPKGMVALDREIPANIGEELTKKIEEMAIKAFKSLGSAGVVRIDFLIDDQTKEVYINEINSCPGSLAYYLWKPKGKRFSMLIDEIVKIGIREFEGRVKKTTSFETNILAGFKGTKGSKF